MGWSFGKFDEDFKQGSVQLVIETGKPTPQVARDLRIDEGCALGTWCRSGAAGAEDGRLA
jgi:hypothetical protein